MLHVITKGYLIHNSPSKPFFDSAIWKTLYHFRMPDAFLLVHANTAASKVSAWANCFKLFESSSQFFGAMQALLFSGIYIPTFSREQSEAPTVWYGSHKTFEDPLLPPRSFQMRTLNKVPIFLRCNTYQHMINTIWTWSRFSVHKCSAFWNPLFEQFFLIGYLWTSSFTLRRSRTNTTPLSTFSGTLF